MFKKILVPVDLTELTISKPALDAAVELALHSKGALRLITVETLLPASFMEYVPVEFDKTQEERANRALEEVSAGLSLSKGDHVACRQVWRYLCRDTGRSR